MKNREIKFRFWDKEENKMISWDEMSNSNLSDFTYAYLNNDIDYIIPLQYIGLKDKTGKEIYEGDILQNEYGEIEIVKYSISESNPCFGHGEYGNETTCGFVLTSHNNAYKIIGNIFENPELIK